MTARAEQKERTRERILAIAKDLFESEAYEAASIRRVATAAGVATGTVLFHFKDKQELLYSALFEDLQAVLADALAKPPGRSLESWLAGVVDGALAYYEARPALSRVLLRESLVASPPWAERFSGQMAALHAGVAARASRARDRGELAPGFNAELFAAAFVSYYFFGLVAWAQHAHPDPRGFIKHLAAHHLAGYKSRRSK